MAQYWRTWEDLLVLLRGLKATTGWRRKDAGFVLWVSTAPSLSRRSRHGVMQTLCAHLVGAWLPSEEDAGARIRFHPDEIAAVKRACSGPIRAWRPCDRYRHISLMRALRVNINVPLALRTPRAASPRNRQLEFAFMVMGASP